MNELVSLIQSLPREQALEASGFVSRGIVGNGAAFTSERAALEPLIEHPYENLPELEQLARLTLVTAAMVPEYEDLVRNAVEGAGKKQFILGGTEIVALAIVGLGALQVIVAKGRTGTSETITIQEKDGKTTTTIKNEITYGLGPTLGSILSNYFRR
jgi:hypothetical protein